ncbi:MAG TPA: hypothetical protein VGN13_01865 [Solirubrobacteraceae bacterium]|jgi:hypothetical protein
MSDRGTQLLQVATGQIADLTGLLSTRDESVLRLPCPGREKLGDGTVAACASHTADNYRRIAAFLGGEDQPPPGHGARGQGPIRDSRHGGGHGPSVHAPPGAGDVDRQSVLERLSAGREALSLLADLTDEQLDTVPPASDMKFCDGQRSLHQIVTNLLNHQSHQLDALRAALE